MQVCDVCRSSDRVRSFPWGRTVPAGEMGREPHGQFDLCARHETILSEDGLSALVGAVGLSMYGDH